ncbi:MAG TPA: type II toxin-antitoxin system HicA family toxin [Bacteroidetes bacterium]|nr:type II toxin-antitoxin system HicA family toxin [Bacteroidota bacterium]
MKRVDFEKHLKNNGCKTKREGANHSIWQNMLTQAVSAVPRHRELDNNLCKAICKQLGVALPKKY